MNKSIGFRVDEIEKEKLLHLANEKNISISELSRTATLSLLENSKNPICNKGKLSEVLVGMYDLISAEDDDEKRNDLSHILELLRCLI